VGKIMDVWKAEKKVLVAAVILLGTAGAGFAAGAIYVDADAAGANNGSSWGNAYNNLQDALADANLRAKPVEIRVAQGVYKPDEGAGITPGDRTAAFQLINGVTIKGGYAGFGEANPDARDIAGYETILSGDLDGNDVELGGSGWDSIDDFIRGAERQDNSYTVVIGSSVDNSAVLDGLTITGGHANGPLLGECPDVDYRHSAGGGMYNDRGSPTVVRCTFRRNVVESFYGWMHGGGGSYCCGCDAASSCLGGPSGGGMCNRNGSPVLSDCNFVENIAYGADAFAAGGGMFNIGGNPKLTNCIFLRNVATGFDNEYSGGGMYNYNSSAVLTDCSFIGNKATYSSGPGGVTHVYGDNSTFTRCRFEENSDGAMAIGESSPTLIDCVFEGNQYRGLSIGSYSKAVVMGCTFSENDGGGMYVSDNSEPMVMDCTFIGNSASEGGAMHNHYRGNPTVIGCKFFGNTAGYTGGAVYNTSAKPIMINCIFSGNRSIGTLEWNGGGAIYNDYNSDAVLINCTFAGNSAVRGRALACWSYGAEDPSKVRAVNCILRDGGDEIWNSDGSAIEITHSDIQGGFPGAGNIDGDPLFVDADGADNIIGTQDDDLRPVGGSPCIDAGDNGGVPGSVETDIRGRPRIMNERVDMGAYEAQAQVYVDKAIGNDLNDGLTPRTAFATIQKGINSALAGYTVLVYPGLYTEEINFKGKAITVRGAEDAPVLEAPGDYAVSFYTIEGRDSVLKNFVIWNSYVGIFLAGPCSPTIKNVTVADNRFGAAAYGGASPDISNCIFWDNTDGDLFGCEARYSWVQEDIERSPVDGLICHWKFDEGSGDRAYDSALENHLWMSWLHWTSGVIGGALEFDGQRDGGGCEYSSSLDIYTNQITLSGWINLRKDVGNREAAIMARRMVWGLRVFGEGYAGSTGNQLVFQDWGGEGLTYNCISPTQLRANQWYHVAATDDAGMITIYIDGRADWSSSGGYGIPSGVNEGINVGVEEYTAYFNGLMDDLRVYNRALSAEEILELYQNGLLGYGSLAEPLFADSGGGDYHLRSKRGRYWPEHNLWVLDDVTSPCIDGGDPNDYPADERMPNGGRVNMGAYGGTAYASMSECFGEADANCDGVVNMLDFAVMADKWLQAADWAE